MANLPFKFSHRAGAAGAAVVYQYRDASNYREGESVTVRGEITEEMAQVIADALDRAQTGEPHFLPEEVGLERLQERIGDYGSADHEWHELVEIVPADEIPDDAIDAAELVEKFRAAPFDLAAASDRRAFPMSYRGT